MALGAGGRRVHAAHGHMALPLDAAASADMAAERAVVGGKGHALAAMAALGLNVPPAYCVTTEWCDECAHDSAGVVERVWGDVLVGLKWLEEQTGQTFGGGRRPLLLAVRSSGVTSMPGMLETVLDVGIDDAVTDALGDWHSEAFARDTRDRFRRGYRRTAGEVPEDPLGQLRGAVQAVVSSWSSKRVAAYRAHHGLDEPTGIAILLQAMVFGNLDGDSGTGVLFTRDPSSGASTPFGEWLRAAQGDDVVSGTSDCEPLDTLRERLPHVYDELIEAGRNLERLGADVQDVEFTVEAGRLWLLQSRVAQRSPVAALRLALAFRDEGIIDDAAVVDRVTPAQLAAVLSARGTSSGAESGEPPLAKGVPACPGVVSGVAYTSSDDAIEAAENGIDVILVRPTTSPDDVGGIMAARGVVTEVGGASSHAAIVARELGRPAVVGCGVGLSAELAGKLITVDGDTGEVRAGPTSVLDGELDDPELRRFADVVHALSPLRAHADGDCPAVADHSEAAVGAALAAGHTDVAAPEPLLVMHVAARLAGRR